MVVVTTHLARLRPSIPLSPRIQSYTLRTFNKATSQTLANAGGVRASFASPANARRRLANTISASPSDIETVMVEAGSAYTPSSQHKVGR